jgi:predicted MPP superfamily phosphohydrolase
VRRPGRWAGPGGAVAGLTGVGAALASYALFVEPKLFALRRVEVPVLRPGALPIRLLHLSDLHLLPDDQRKVTWVSGLAELHPDVVVNTGDTLSNRRSVPTAVAAFGSLLELPGAFVFGNNDFMEPVRRSPHRYFVRRRPIKPGPPLPWRDLRAAQAERGWLDLTNRRGLATVRGQLLAFAGVNDPHSLRDDYDAIAGPADDTAVVRIGVMHSPEPPILDRFAADGYELLLAGHTHVGQVRLPFVGAVTTNCDLDRSRARGLSRWGASSWLHVSAGIGANPYLPARFLCRPEATLLTLVPRVETATR